jgi:O-antigen/teichoic acid export membrane protein
LENSLIRSTTLLFIGMMVGSLFNYLLQITMGRMLSVQTFGEMNALFSTMVIFGIPFASINNYIAKNISQLHALGKNEKANDLIIKNYKNLFVGSIIIIIFGTVFSKGISEFFKIGSIIPILLLILSIPISLILPINTGILQGLQKFKMLSFISAGSVYKYMFCVFLAAVGLGLNGVMLGIILSLLLIGYISFIPINRHLQMGRETIQKNEKDSLFYVIPIFLANLAFAIFTQSDIILVKYFFTPHEAGIYSSAAIIGKTVMYLPGAVVMYLLPAVASNKAKDEATLHLILKAITITILLSGSGAIILYLFPREIVSIFFGSRFISAIPIIGLFAITMLPMAVMMILMNYNMAKGEKYFAYIMLICSVIQIIGIINFHDSFVIILRVILYSGIFCMMTLFLMLVFEYYKGKVSTFTSYIVYKSFDK